MLFQLPTGGTIHIDTERFLSMSDEQLEKYIMYARGSEMNDPFVDSVLDGSISDDDLDIMPDIPDTPLDIPRE